MNENDGEIDGFQNFAFHLAEGEKVMGGKGTAKEMDPFVGVSMIDNFIFRLFYIQDFLLFFLFFFFLCSL